MLDVSGKLVLQTEPDPVVQEAITFINWVIVALIVLLALLLPLLGLVLLWYKRWMDRDALHKSKVEEQLERLSEVIGSLSRDRQGPG